MGDKKANGMTAFPEGVSIHLNVHGLVTIAARELTLADNNLHHNFVNPIAPRKIKLYTVWCFLSTIRLKGYSQ